MTKDAPRGTDLDRPTGDGEAPHLTFASPTRGAEGMVVEELSTNEQPSFAPFKASRWVVPVTGASDVDQHVVKEIWFIASGIGVLEYDGRTVHVAARDVLHMESQKPHRVVNVGAEPLVVFSVWWQP
jgi:mannose-6-phosphate isomerase-like protein (cupin superfamily)